MCVHVCVCVHSYGDMRIAMNSLMVNKWNVLDNFKSRYIPCLIGPFLKVSLIPHTGRGAAESPGPRQIPSSP